MDIDALFVALEHNIHVILLLENTTHIMQPMDVGFFAPFKKFWKDVVRRRQEIFPEEDRLHNTVVAGLVKATLDEMGEARIHGYIKKGFENTGLYPINPSKVIEGELMYSMCTVYNNFTMCN